MSLANIPEIRQLSREEKILLVEELWDEIARSGDFPISVAERTILTQRLAEHTQSPKSALTKTQLKKRLAKRQ